METIYYIIGLGAIFLILGVGFSLYLWRSYKKEKVYQTAVLPGIEELTPEDLVSVTDHSKDTTALPSIEEFEEESIAPQLSTAPQGKKNQSSKPEELRSARGGSLENFANSNISTSPIKKTVSNPLDF